MQVLFNSNTPLPLAAAIVVQLANSTSVNFKFDDKTQQVVLQQGDKSLRGNFAIALYLAKSSGQTQLLTSETGSDFALEADTVQFLELSLLNYNAEKLEALDYPLQQLNHFLQTKTYLNGTKLSIADFSVFETLKNNKQFKAYQVKFGEHIPHLQRWFTHLESQPSVQKALEVLTQVIKTKGQSLDKKTCTQQTTPTNQQKSSNTKGEKEANYVELPNAEMGKVCTRFPPEPSGYLHIGHAKAAMLNFYFATHYKGQLILRFDDTNPDKEKHEFEVGIFEDLKKLGITYSKLTYTSDSFDLCEQYCEKLLREGKAYVEDTPQEQMSQEKIKGIESKSRSRSIEESLQLWEEMKKGSPRGKQCCVRIKFDIQSNNLTLRDPVCYRCKETHHPRCGDKYKCYPTYDFACPIVDSVEGVTHALRTSEYNDRNEQYYRFVDAMGIRKPLIWDYSRLNFDYAVMSKRKLTKLVNDNVVEGWDDPRFPTIRGLLRRGLHVEPLKQFIMEQGASRSVATLQWEKLWALNRKYLDPIVPRYTALNKTGLVKFYIADGPQSPEERSNPKHKKNAELGTKTTIYYNQIYLDAEDANAIENGEEVTLMDWGNAICEKVTKDAQGKVTEIHGKLNLQGSVKDTKKKLTWLAAVDSKLIPTTILSYDHILTKPKIGPEDDFMQCVNLDSKHESHSLGDYNLKDLKKGEHIQLERRGYFICDAPADANGKGLVLIFIPDGHVAKK